MTLSIGRSLAVMDRVNFHLCSSLATLSLPRLPLLHRPKRLTYPMFMINFFMGQMTLSRFHGNPKIHV